MTKSTGVGRGRRNHLMDLTGQTFGRLTVISRAEQPGPGQARWACKCSCGGSSVTGGYELRKGLTQSCGCLNREALAATLDPADQAHGTLNRYSNLGCRCRQCKDASRESARERRARLRASSGQSAPAHGTHYAYVDHGCRCDVCCRAMRQLWDEARARERDKNEASRDSARKHNQVWTSADLELVTRSDLTNAEKAAILGRTIRAVRAVQLACKTDPRKAWLLGRPPVTTTGP